jgi:carboxyl-terminal processing protease
MTKTYARKYLPLIVCASIGLGIILGGYLAGFSGRVNTKNVHKNKLNNLINYIENDYVDAINTDSIVSVTVNSILANLDPHSVYIPKEEYQSVTENMRGEIVGIGVSFYKIKDSVSVIQVLPNGPSQKAGLLSGDRIVYADDVDLTKALINTVRVTRHRKGSLPTPVQLKVKRYGEDSLLSFNLKRNIIPIQSVDASFMLTEDIAYIRINRFAETTSYEFKKAFEVLKQNSPSAFVLDVRDNGGGFLKEAITIVDEFLVNNTPILFTKNRKGNMKETYATKREGFVNGEVYVLINEKSASASEILAGAIQDNDRGYIVGRRSFGKGLVQREMKLGDGSAVRLTVSRYYTPTGRSIQRPYENGNKAYYNEYRKRYENGEFIEKDSIKINDSLIFETPKGRKVYGGGGIVPDIFVAKDNSNLDEDLEYMLKGGILDRFVFDELDKNRTYYNSFSLDEFLTTDVVDDSFIENYNQYLKDLAFLYNFDTRKEKLKRYLKSVMAQQLFNADVATQILAKEDKSIQAVIDHFEGLRDK